MSKRVIVTVAGTTRDLPLEGPVVVGRDPLCTVSVDDPQLSRRHAEVVSTAFGTRVRDLGSQNGIYINGVQVTEALLQPDDVVQVASLALRVVENDDGNTASEPVLADRGTAILTRPPARPVSHAGDQTPASETPREEQDALRGPTSNRVGTVSRRRPRGAWRGRVMLMSLAVAAVTFGLAALPSFWWHGQERRAAERREAAAITGQLAADAARAIEGDHAVPSATDAVLRLPGVSEALVLSPEGRVLAPASRAGQSLSTLGGLKRPLAEVVREGSAAVGGVVEIARPVAIAGNRRAAIAWIAFEPKQVSGSSVTWLVPALLVACAAGLCSGWFLAQRTERALASLNEQLDAALAGQIDVVHDPLGARPVRDLTETLNYLVTRLRASASGDLRRVRASAAESSVSAGLAMPVQASSPQSSFAVGASQASNGTAGHVSVAGAAAARRDADRSLESIALEVDPDLGPGDASLVTNSELRIIRANAACATVLGGSPERMIGLHLLDAIPNAELADGILTCLSRLTPGGQAETHVASGSRVPLRVSVGRTAKDAPVSIVLRPEEVQAE